METYGVSFDGFEPSCGWPLYRHVENEHLPYLKAEVERWRKRRDAAAGERTALKEFKDELDALSKSRKGLSAKLQAKVDGGESTLDEIMPLGVKEAEIETDGSWRELSSWLDDAKSRIERMELYCVHACDRADCGLGMMENCLESTVLDIRFWEHTLELQKAYWVFERSELKYKTKICREIVKSLGDYIGECREQLGRYAEVDKSTSSLYGDIKWLFDEAQEDLAYYRQVKADISAVGVEEALKHSSRKVTQPVG